MEFEVVLDKKVIMGFVIIHVEMVLHQDPRWCVSLIPLWVNAECQKNKNCDLPIKLVLWLNVIMLFQRIILNKINHGNNLILCQIIQARLELGILPLGFKIVNKKFNQFKL